MGVVYAAHDFALDRRVSLKLVRSGPGRDAELRRARLLGEAQALARVSHPNVVAVHDVGTLGSEVYVALEHVPGLTLGEWLRGAPRSPRAICEVFAQAGRGLLAVHSAGLVHRDVKPDNILLGDDGRVRLADFGLAVAAGDEGDATAGTPGYMPLEQLRGEPVDARADQFAFAVALFEALTGERPYGPRGATRPALRERLSSGVPVLVPRLPGTPPTLRRALQRALAPAAENRFPSVAPLLGALESPPARRPVMPLGLVAVGVVLVGLVAGAALPFDERILPEADLQEVVPASGAAQWVPQRAVAGARGVSQPSVAQRSEGATPVSLHSAPASDLAHPAASVSPGGARAPSGSAASPRGSGSLEVRGAAFPDWAASVDGLAEALAGLFKALRTALDVERGITVTVGGPVVAAGPVMVVPAPDPLHVNVQPASSGGGAPPGAVQADGSALRIASLEQQLNASLVVGDPTQIAEARFALAEALAPDPTQRARALSLAEQAREDLSGAADDASTRALRQKLDQWISEHNSHVPVGAGGGKLTRSGDLVGHDSQVP
jgi:serine/threonine protein kinase